MANALYPFPAVPYAATYCYPPPASAHAPPPGFFPAPPYAFPYPAPTQIHGYYHPSPFPLFPPPPPPPTYPYPPPASAYTAASSFSPNWPIWPPPPPALSPTPTILSPAPAPGVSLSSIATPTSPSTTTSKMQAAPTPMLELQEPDGESSSSRERETSRDLHHSSFGGPILSQPPPSRNPPIPKPSTPSGDLSSWSPLCSRPMLQQQKDSPTTSWPEPSPALDLEKSKTSAEAQIRAEASISKNMPRAVLDLKRRLDELQARDRTSVDNLQGELAKLTSMASQFALSISKQTNPALPASSPLRVTGTAPVASKVFDTMPTSSSGCSKVFGKQSSAAASSPTTSGSSRFGASGSTYAAPQVFGETPTSSLWQGTHGSVPDCCSGRHNLSLSACVSNFSEQNFGEMAQQYDFHNLSRKTVLLSDGSEHSYFALPENYPLERAVPEPVFDVYDDDTEGCSSKSVDVIPGTPGQQTHEEDPLANEKLAKSFRKASENAFSEQLLRYIVKALETEQTSAYVLDYTFQQQQQNAEKTSTTVQQLRDQQLSVLVTHERRKEWDPGDTSLHFLFTTAVGATKLDYAAVYKSAMAESLCATTAVQVTDCLQYIASNGINHIMQSAAHLPQGNYLCFLYYNSVLKTGYQGMRDVWAFSIAKGRQVQWDPGIELIMFLYKQTHAHIIQLADLTSTATDDFLQGQQPCLHICLYCPHSDPLQQLVCYSSMFSSSAMSMSTAATLHVSLVLSSGKTAQEEKYAAAMYQLLKPQIPMRKTSRIWDPGIEFILYELWWFSLGTGYVLRHLLAVKFGTPSYTYSANMYCPPANLIQQRRNTAALLQFGHSAVCVWDPGIAFGYQQGVQENHNGKQLLASSKNCLHIWEIDILFITFLPP